MLSNIAVRANLIPSDSGVRYRYLSYLSAAELLSIDRRLPEWGPFLLKNREGSVFGVPTAQQLEEWQHIQATRVVTLNTKTRKYRWVIGVAHEEFAVWCNGPPQLTEESAIEYLWLTTTFMDVAGRYLSTKSPLSDQWIMKRKLQLAIKALEDAAILINEYASTWLKERGIDEKAQARRIGSLEDSWQLIQSAFQTK